MKKPPKPICRIYVRQLSDQYAVKSIPIFSKMSENNHEKFMMGLLRNMNTDKFYVDDSEYDALPAKAE